MNVGVTAIDIGGQGGTNFAAVENEEDSECFLILITGAYKQQPRLLEATSTNNNLSFIASGGIQTALDVAKQSH